MQTTETPLAERDFFTDNSILRDPYAYFQALRQYGPVFKQPGKDVIFVTGFDETLEILKNTEDFSSIISTGGPAVPLAFPVTKEDISEDIEEHREEFHGGDLLVARDGEAHRFSRSLLSSLFTPSRLKANESYMKDLANKMASEAAAKGGCDLIKDIATPFATLVVADLLGVPEDDRQVFSDAIATGVNPGSTNPEDIENMTRPLLIMSGYFVKYVEDRRRNPRNDVLTELSNAKYPDGSTPDVAEIVRLATFLFGAGQDTSAKLLGNSMRRIIDQPGLQEQVRADHSLIGPLLEEVLRLEGSSKMTARLARRDTKIGNMKIPVGSRVMVTLAAANRDPARWENPDDFQLHRPRIMEHLSFGRGAHVCIGAPLARAEVRIVLDRLLTHTSHIDISPEEHGEKGNRNLNYEASFIIRGLTSLNLVMTPN